MRKHKLIPLLALWLLAGASTAHADVPVGDDGSLRPRDGAELVEAAAQLSASGPAVSIVLGRGDYEIDRPIVLTARSGDRLTGFSAGETTLRGAAGLTSLLQVDGPATVSNLALRPAEDPSTTVGALLQARGDATLEDLFTTVPDSLPNVTAIDTAGATLRGIEVESLTPSRPALHATGRLTVEGSSIYGGNPTVDLDAGALLSRTTMTRSFLAGGPDSDAILRVRGGSGAGVVALAESIVSGGEAEAPTLVDLVGSSSLLGTTTFDAQRSTFSGSPASITLRSSAALQAIPTVVTLGGVLALGSETTVDCRGNALLGPVVTIAGIYRTGEHDTGGACAIVETGLRTGGDPSLTTERGLAWGSPAIDAIARPIGIDQDAYRQDRTSTGPNTSRLTPTDLGAIEYQYLPPSLDDPKAERLEDGTVAFTVSASDGNERESEQLTILWTFSDGSTAVGPEARHQFPAGAIAQATVTATDPSGLQATATVSATAPPADPFPELAGPTPSPEPAATATPEATPTPAPTPQQTLPESVTLPVPSEGGEQSALTSGTGVVRSVVRTSARTQRAALRRSGLGVARAGEAGVKLDLASASNLTVYARKRIGTKLATVPNARFSIDVSAGLASLHLTSRIGTAELRPGLYRFTVLVRPVKGTSVRRDLYVRVVR